MKKLFIPVFYSLIPFLGLLLFLPTRTFMAPVEESSPPDKILMETTMNEPSGICGIDDMELKYRSPCDENGTLDDYFDDTFTANIRVWFTDWPTTGDIVFTNQHIIGGSYSFSVSSIPPDSTSHEFFGIPMHATPDNTSEPITMTVFFFCGTGL